MAANLAVTQQKMNFVRRRNAVFAELFRVGGELNQRGDFGFARQLRVVDFVLALSVKNEEVGESLKATIEKGALKDDRRLRAKRI